MTAPIARDEVQKLLDEAEAMRNAVAGIETKGYFHAINWADKPHRVVFDGARRMEVAARSLIAAYDEIDRLRAQHAAEALAVHVQMTRADRLAADNARLAAQVEALTGWRDDPESNDAWCAGNDYALTRLCKVLGVDPGKVSWDGSDGSLDEEADALVWRILQAALEAAEIASWPPEKQAEYRATVAMRGVAKRIAEDQIAARDAGEGK